MRPWLKRIDLDSFAWTRLELGPERRSWVVGRTEGQLLVDSPYVSRKHCRIVTDGARWLVEDLSSTSGTKVNGQRVVKHVLEHGDVISLYGTLLVFLTRPDVSDPAMERALDENPDDPARVLVWADGLIERGDPLGEELVVGTTSPAALEGLNAAVEQGRLELTLRHGLIETASIRCTDESPSPDLELLARLLSTKTARWLRRLTVDLSSWSVPNQRRMPGDEAAVLRGIIAAANPQTLREVSLGYATTEAIRSPFIDALLSRLAARFTKLETPAGRVLPFARQAWLTVEQIPEALDFQVAGTLGARRIPMQAGIWVGSAQPNSLRAVAPGVTRVGPQTSFLIREQSPQWCLIPFEPGLHLNGRAARPTHLLPGDVIEDLRGMRYRFDVTFGD